MSKNMEGKQTVETCWSGNTAKMKPHCVASLLPAIFLATAVDVHEASKNSNQRALALMTPFEFMYVFHLFIFVNYVK